MAVRNLDTRDKFAVLFDCAEFVHSAEGSVGKAGYEFRSDTVNVDFCVLRVQSKQNVFVDVVGGEYLAIGMPRSVQHLARFAAEIRKVAAVQSYTYGFVSCGF